MKNPIKDEKEDNRGYTSRRVYRGGGWRSNVRLVRVSFRISIAPGFTDDCFGFRIVRNKQ